MSFDRHFSKPVALRVFCFSLFLRNLFQFLVIEKSKCFQKSFLCCYLEHLVQWTAFPINLRKLQKYMIYNRWLTWIYNARALNFLKTFDSKTMGRVSSQFSFDLFLKWVFVTILRIWSIVALFRLLSELICHRRLHADGATFGHVLRRGVRTAYIDFIILELVVLECVLIWNLRSNIFLDLRILCSANLLLILVLLKHLIL